MKAFLLILIGKGRILPERNKTKKDESEILRNESEKKQDESEDNEYEPISIKVLGLDCLNPSYPDIHLPIKPPSKFFGLVYAHNSFFHRFGFKVNLYPTFAV